MDFALIYGPGSGRGFGRHVLLAFRAGTNRVFVAAIACGTVERPMATMLISPLHARLTGQAARRGLIPRVPTADALLADVETWLRSTFPDAVRSIERPVREQGEAELTVELHPAAPPLVMTTSDGSAPIRRATEDRASSRTALACCPKWWTLDALP